MSYIRVLELDKGSINLETATQDYEGPVPKPDKYYMPVQCHQCENAPCVKACPVEATWMENDGVVVVDYNWCIGCRYCMAACPYDARRFNWKKPELEPHPQTHLKAWFLGEKPLSKPMASDKTPPQIDFRVRKINAFLIAATLLLYLPGLRYVAAILIFHYLDWGWTGGVFSPFSKIAHGVLKFSPDGRQAIEASPFVQRDRIGSGLSCGMMVAPFVAIQWPFTLLAYGLLGLVAMDFLSAPPGTPTTNNKADAKDEDKDEDEVT